jgi:hypothetical protein
MPPEIPTGCETGTEWAAQVENLPNWMVMSSFAGYDFGRWPEVIVALYTNASKGQFGLAVYKEGAATVTWYPNRFERWSACLDHAVAPYRAEPRHS